MNGNGIDIPQVWSPPTFQTWLHLCSQKHLDIQIYYNNSHFSTAATVHNKTAIDALSFSFRNVVTYHNYTKHSAHIVNVLKSGLAGNKAQLYALTA